MVEMKKQGGMQRIPLAVRLKKAECMAWDFLNVFAIYPDDFYEMVSAASGDASFAEDCRDGEEDTVEYKDCPSIAQVIAGLRDMSHERQERYLYRILIEPFVSIEDFEFDFERSGKNYE